MRFLFIFISLLFISEKITAQQLTGSQLLDKTIAYHDPNGNWQGFNGTLFVTMETPDAAKRDSEIHINLPEEYFYVKAIRDTTTTEYTVRKDSCDIALNSKTGLSKAILKQHNLSCDRANLYKNYYTYLYGLPMKLRDEGTHISEKVITKNFKGKDYLVLKITYAEAVGKDVWYFYFNPETYAMEVYQFFKTDDTGKEKSDSGEYILLSKTKTINGVNLPKTRAWYYNKDDKYLGTDVLK